MADDVKTIFLSDVKLYRASAVLSERYSPGIDHVSPVPVLADDERMLGWASVDFMDGPAKARLVLSYATPERLDLETGSKKLYAHARLRADDLTRLVIEGIVLKPIEAYWGQPAVGEPLL